MASLSLAEAVRIMHITPTIRSGSRGASLNRTAGRARFMPDRMCDRQVLGMVIGTALGWGNSDPIALAVVLHFSRFL